MGILYNVPMRLTISVKPNARNEKIEKVSEKEYRVWLKAPARKGLANQALVEFLSSYFDRPKSAIVIYKGTGSRKKIVDIL